MNGFSVSGTKECRSKAEELAQRLGVVFSENEPDRENLALFMEENGLSLRKNGMILKADLTEMLPRLKQSNLEREMLVKAVRIKGKKNLSIIDATAGFGEDSVILAAAGHDITMFEYNPVIYELLSDALTRAKEDERLAKTVAAMHLFNEDSVSAMRKMKEEGSMVDVILLDPMFPERQKSASVKKKFQLIHELEAPCSNENDLLEAALSLNAGKIVIKRPAKGPFLGDCKPDYSVEGKAIRYDIIFGKNIEI